MLGFGSNSQLSRFRPIQGLGMARAALEAPANNVFRVGDTSVFPNNAFTICFWTNTLASGGTFNNNSGRETSTTTRNFELRFFTNGSPTNAFDFLTSPAGNNLEQHQVTMSAALNKDQWYFVAVSCTRVGGGVKKDAYVFSQSELMGSGTTGTYTGMFSSNNVALQIGSTRDASGAVFSNQRMNSFGFWNGYKDGSFIKSIWHSGRGLSYVDLTTDQKSGLVEWWNLNDWDGTDCTGNFASINAVRNSFGTTLISLMNVVP